MNETHVQMIFAMDEECGIGKGGGIPWHYKEDFQFFAKTTKNSTCIMGRKTYESILEVVGERDILLPNRLSIVVTSQSDLKTPGAISASSISDALAKATHDTVSIIGGVGLYEECIGIASAVYVTRIPGTHDCDTFIISVMSTIDTVGSAFTMQNVTPSGSKLEYYVYNRGAA